MAKADRHDGRSQPWRSRRCSQPWREDGEPLSGGWRPHTQLLLALCQSDQFQRPVPSVGSGFVFSHVSTTESIFVFLFCLLVSSVVFSMVMDVMRQTSSNLLDLFGPGLLQEGQDRNPQFVSRY